MRIETISVNLTVTDINITGIEIDPDNRSITIRYSRKYSDSSVPVLLESYTVGIEDVLGVNGIIEWAENEVLTLNGAVKHEAPVGESSIGDSEGDF